MRERRDRRHLRRVWLAMEDVKVIAITEFGRLEVAKSSTRRKRRLKFRAWLKRNHDLAYGFDFGCSSDEFKIIRPRLRYDYDVTLYARLGLYCYNYQNGTNFKFVSWEKYNTMDTSYSDYYLTFEAMDPACNSVFSFQTLFRDQGCTTADTYRINTWRIFACRPKCGDSVDDYWDEDEKMDPFYTSPMPKWLSDEALASDNKKYYVVQESELHENDWLHLFIEIAFFTIARSEMVASTPLEINKVVVQTKEDYITEAREKLHAENAIFYISYKYRGVSTSGFAGDHKAIVRKTTDGIPGHMSLEVASERRRSQNVSK